MKHPVVLAITVVSLVAVGSFVSRPPRGAASAADKKEQAADKNAKAANSIALRVRRIVYEDAYIAVPVTDAIVKKKADGKSGIDLDAFMAEGIRISTDARVEWKFESAKTELHPIQQPKPDSRRSFDPSAAEPAK